MSQLNSNMIRKYLNVSIRYGRDEQYEISRPYPIGPTITKYIYTTFMETRFRRLFLFSISKLRIYTTEVNILNNRICQQSQRNVGNHAKIKTITQLSTKFCKYFIHFN